MAGLNNQRKKKQTSRHIENAAKTDKHCQQCKSPRKKFVDCANLKLAARTILAATLVLTSLCKANLNDDACDQCKRCSSRK